MRLFARVVFAVLGLALVACQATPTAGAVCARAADCPMPLACDFGRCRQVCASARDCPVGAHCLVGVDGGVCSLDVDLGCESGVGRTCASGLVCVADRCEQTCSSMTPCATGATCTPTSGGTMFCAPYAVDAGTSDAASSAGAPCDAVVDLTGIDAGAGTVTYRTDTSSTPFDGILPFDGCSLATHVEHQIALRYRMRSTAYLVVDTANAYTLQQFDTITGVFAACSATAERIACQDDIGDDPRSHVLTDTALAAGREVIIGIGGFTMPPPGRMTNALLEVHVDEVPARNTGEACDPTGVASICLGSGVVAGGSGCVATSATTGTCTTSTAEMEGNERGMPQAIDASGPVLILGSLEVGTDEDCFAFDAPGARSLLATVSDGRGACPQTAAAVDLVLRDGSGNQIAIAPGAVPDTTCPTLDGTSSGPAHALAAGRYVLCVQPVMAVPFFGYDLSIALVP